MKPKPRYNGSCEASIQAMQKRTAFFAARHGRPGHWMTSDLESAQRQANDCTAPKIVRMPRRSNSGARASP